MDDAIHLNPANKGLLHKALGVPVGQKIPLSKLRKAAKSKNPTLRKRAQFALNARKFHHDAEPDADVMVDFELGDEPVTQHYEGMMRPNPKD